MILQHGTKLKTTTAFITYPGRTSVSQNHFALPHTHLFPSFHLRPQVFPLYASPSFPTHSHRNLLQLILALSGGERWQSRQEYVHMWNVKYWNCIIKDTVWSPTLTLLLMLLMLLLLCTKCLLFCFFFGRWVWRWGHEPDPVTDCYWWVLKRKKIVCLWKNCVMTENFEWFKARDEVNVLGMGEFFF